MEQSGGVTKAHFRLLEKSAILSDDCEGELVVSLGDECYCVAVPGLEGEGVSGVRAAGARCVDGKEHSGTVYYV